ncbi:MAG TPA: elongation factor Tu [Chloroflexia bacterium]|nr:elongation factor Tu [Chloroflexia bacterium]
MLPLEERWKLPPEEQDIEVTLYYLTREEGGRKKPAFSGYRPQFHYSGRDWDAVHSYPDVEFVQPGQSARAYLSFLSPECHVGRLQPGTEFLVREGQRVVARGVVTRILNLEESAKRIGRDPAGCWD